MMDINLHGVQRFELSDVKELINRSTGEAFYIRTLTVWSKDGSTCITMFSDVEGNLLTETRD